jgi:hypothetical protein
MLEIADPLRLLRSRPAPREARGTPPAPAPLPWVGLGEVVEAPEDGPARVRLWDATGQVVTPTWALPFAYLPRPGDLLVVIARGERSWVLSVARGRGTSLLWTRGDLRVAAGGALRLAGDVGVRLVGDVVTLRARAVEVAAEALHVVAEDALERVAGLSRLVAGAVQRVTAGTESVVARRVTLLGRDLVKLDGGVTVIG